MRFKQLFFFLKMQYLGKYKIYTKTLYSTEDTPMNCIYFMYINILTTRCAMNTLHNC